MPAQKRWISSVITYGTRPYGGSTWTNSDLNFYSNVSISSVNHRLPIDPSGDTGGYFNLAKKTEVATPATYVYPGFGFQTYRGDYTIGAPAQTPGDSLAPAEQKSNLVLYGLGAQAIARSLPNNPTFSLATFIGELREGLPSLIGLNTLRNRSHLARSAGSEYLNIEFGWKPLVSDVRNFAYAVQNSHQILEQYHKDSDKKVKRAYHFPSDSGTSVHTGSFIPIPTDYPGGFLNGTQIQTSGSDVWFNGAFRYHIPMSGDFLDRMRRYASDANKLLGVRITPEVLWNVAPWTWAIDWFTDTGDLMTNISNLGSDGMYLQYGYVMSHSWRETYRAQQGSGGATFTSREDYKLRLTSTPFGFGVDLTALSARQSAILASIAATRK